VQEDLFVLIEVEIMLEVFEFSYDDDIYFFQVDYHHHYQLNFVVVQVILEKFFVVYNVLWKIKMFSSH